MSSRHSDQPRSGAFLSGHARAQFLSDASGSCDLSLASHDLRRPGVRLDCAQRSSSRGGCGGPVHLACPVAGFRTGRPFRRTRSSVAPIHAGPFGSIALARALRHLSHLTVSARLLSRQGENLEARHSPLEPFVTSRTASKVGLEWVEPGFLPKAPSRGPKHDPNGKGRSGGKSGVPSGRSIKVMVPLT
jgi:hypothetical protein